MHVLQIGKWLPYCLRRRQLSRQPLKQLELMLHGFPPLVLTKGLRLHLVMLTPLILDHRLHDPLKGICPVFYHWSGRLGRCCFWLSHL